MDIEQPKDYNSYQQIGCQSGSNDNQILPVAVGKPNKHQQDGKRHQCSSQQLRHLLTLLLGTIIRQLEIHLLMNASLQLFHLLLNDIRHSHGLTIRRNINIDIYRVQSIHPIIAVGVLILHLHGSQIVEINHLSIYIFQRHLPQRFSKQLGGEMQGYLLSVSLSRRVHHRTDDFILPHIVAYAIRNVIRRDAVGRKCHRVITDFHVCICRACHFHLVNAIHSFQLPDHILLHKILNQLRLYVGIHQISQQ